MDRSPVRVLVGGAIVVGLAAAAVLGAVLTGDRDGPAPVAAPPPPSFASVPPPSRATPGRGPVDGPGLPAAPPLPTGADPAPTPTQAPVPNPPPAGGHRPPPPQPQPAPRPAQPPAGPLRVTVQATTWDGHYQGEYAIHNTGPAPVTGWSVTVTFASAATLVQAWDATGAPGAGNTVTFTPKPYDATVPTTGPVTFGFTVSGDAVPQAVSCTVDGRPC
jgi:hypothetical protein